MAAEFSALRFPERLRFRRESADNEDMEKTKDIEEHVRLVALGAAQISYNISYAQDKRGLYDPDTKERTQAIAENLMFFLQGRS